MINAITYTPDEKRFDNFFVMDYSFRRVFTNPFPFPSLDQGPPGPGMSPTKMNDRSCND